MCCQNSNAQIVLEKQDFNSWAPTSNELTKLDTAQPYPLINLGSNSSWDFSSVNYLTESLNIYRSPASDTSFPNATFKDSIKYTNNANMSYKSAIFGEVAASGVKYYGEIVAHTLIPIGTITGGANDSIVFPSQQIIYSNPLFNIQFPATMNSAWESQYNFSTIFTLTVGAYGLNNTPCARKAYVTQKDSVVAWGSAKIKNGSGVISPLIDVLLIKSHVKVVDSYFMNGAPAPDALLSAFGLTQGQIYEKFEYKLQSQGEVTPILTASFSDSTYSNNAVNYYEVFTGVVNTTGISELQTMNFHLFPNPVEGDLINIQMENVELGTMYYNIVNIEGRIIDKGRIFSPDKKIQIKLNNTMNVGYYYLQINPTNQTGLTLPFIKNK